MLAGAFFAILGAATFGLNDATVRRGVVTGSVVQGMAITVPIGLPLFFVAALATGELFNIAEVTSMGAAMLALAGVAHFVWGRYCNYRAVKAMGGNRAGPVQQVALLVALVLAMTILDETIGWIRALGILLIIAGPTIMLERKAAPPNSDSRNAPAEVVFIPRLREGYIFALLSATGYGVSPILISAGLEESGLSLVGGMISYAAAAFIVGTVLLFGKNLRTEVKATERTNVRWFLISGIAVFLAQMFRYLALAIAPVSVVASLMRLGLAFRLIFGYFLNRNYESFEPRVLLGIAISILGGLALTASI